MTEVFPQALVAARLARVRSACSSRTTRPSCRGSDNLAGRAVERARLGDAARGDLHVGDRPPRRRARRCGRTSSRSGSTSTGSPAGRRCSRAGSSATSRGSPSRRASARSWRPRRSCSSGIRTSASSIAGDGELRSELEALAAPLGDRFVLLGARDDVPDLLASFDVFAFPSRFEGLCVAVIEAQAAGVPVVATPVGGIRETVVDGETGWLVPPRRRCRARGPDLLGARPPERGAAASRTRRCGARASASRSSAMVERDARALRARDPVEP